VSPWSEFASAMQDRKNIGKTLD